MKINVTVRTGAREERIEEVMPGEYRVSVRERPIAGKANAAVIRALAARFGVPQTAVALTRGHTGRRKIIEIDIPR